MKTALKRLVGVAAVSALLVGGFSTSVSASVNTPNGKKPNVAINEYKSAKAVFKTTMKVYIDSKKAGMAEYRAALAAFKRHFVPGGNEREMTEDDRARLYCLVQRKLARE